MASRLNRPAVSFGAYNILAANYVATNPDAICELPQGEIAPTASDRARESLVQVLDFELS